MSEVSVYVIKESIFYSFRMCETKYYSRKLESFGSMEMYRVYFLYVVLCAMFWTEAMCINRKVYKALSFIFENK
jgi:hypothetical protein